MSFSDENDTRSLTFLDNDEIDFDNDYDYVVVGSGPAGSILAYDLATKTRKSVLLLEAGPVISLLVSSRYET